MGYSYSYLQKEILSPNAALHFNTGYFVGKITAAKMPFFAGKPIISPRPSPIPIPRFRPFSDKVALATKEALMMTNNTLEPNLIKSQQYSVETVIQWNYKRVFFEVEEILFRHSI
jgi:hypothetical protein